MNSMDSAKDHEFGLPNTRGKLRIEVLGIYNKSFYADTTQTCWLEIPPCKLVGPFARDRERMFTGVGFLLNTTSERFKIPRLFGHSRESYYLAFWGSLKQPKMAKPINQVVYIFNGPN